MKIKSQIDQNFLSQIVGLYSIDSILARVSEKEQEIGTYFYQLFSDLLFHPIVFKYEGIWFINVNKNTISVRKIEEKKLANIYEIVYVEVLERINLLERLHNEHLIYFSEDLKKDSNINIKELLPESRKIEDSKLCELLNKYENTKIYPSSDLCRLVANGFQSDDEKKYWMQYYLSIIAVFVAIALPIILNKCTSTKIDEAQIERIIQKIEDQQKTELQDSVMIICTCSQNQN